MAIDRRTFVTSISGAAAAVSGLASLGCDDGFSASAIPAHSLLIAGIEPEALVNRINADAEFLLRARYWDALVRLIIGDTSYDVRIQAGRVAAINPSRDAAAASVRISGPADAWAHGHAARGLQIDGDQIGHIAPYRGAILRIIATIREASGHPASQITATEVDRLFDAAIGRYVYVRIRGVQYRIYFEETGSGIPLLVQHLAGGDGRVWRHLLEDSEVQKHFRIVVYDLPYHGKSLPPTTRRWWTEPYRPTEGFFVDAILAISRALKLERPVYLGNGIGGYLAPALAYYHPDDFRAIIAVNSGIASRVPLARLRGEIVADSSQPNPGNHPRVGNERHGTSVYEITSPEATEESRRELEWIWRQGAPGVFAGDTMYFANDYDLTGGKAAEIDTSKVDVFLVDGEYHAKENASNNGSTLAAEIKNSTYVITKGGSHPMVDNYPRLRESLIPIFDTIRKKYSTQA